MLLTDGPERNTIQWSPDGIHFEIMSHIKGGPEAAGLVRGHVTDKDPLDALRWGLTHQYASRDSQHIRGSAPTSLSAHEPSQRIGSIGGTIDLSPNSETERLRWIWLAPWVWTAEA